MASTNKTTHYNLDQYISTDKPTYLTDYNNDMSAIDTGMYNAQQKADSAYTLAGSADGKADTAITNAGTAQTDASTALTRIGNLANLTTTEKTSVVGAVNELDSDLDSLSTEVYKTKRVSLATGDYYYETGHTTINLSDDFRNYDDIIIGGQILTYIFGQTVLATDKIELNKNYVLFVGRDASTYMSVSFIFTSYTQIEINNDFSNWGGNKGAITFVEGQHL